MWANQIDFWSLESIFHMLDHTFHFDIQQGRKQKILLNVGYHSNSK